MLCLIEIKISRKEVRKLNCRVLPRNNFNLGVPIRISALLDKINNSSITKQLKSAGIIQTEILSNNLIIALNYKIILTNFSETNVLFPAPILKKPFL